MRLIILLPLAAFVLAGYYDPNHFPMPSTNDSVPFVDCNGGLITNDSLACGITYEFCVKHTRGSHGWDLVSWNFFVP
jgi:hypothetical protein